eukprot:3149617-Pyramimonas_sp.AAC.1
MTSGVWASSTFGGSKNWGVLIGRGLGRGQIRSRALRNSPRAFWKAFWKVLVSSSPSAIQRWCSEGWGRKDGKAQWRPMPRNALLASRVPW